LYKSDAQAGRNEDGLDSKNPADLKEARALAMADSLRLTG
jgi:hypothetical protein